jgi:hypothetical protein
MNIGRNSPCPCGSGKKIKKCCLDNPDSVPGKKYLYKIVVARSDITEAMRTCDLFLSKIKSINDELYFPLLCSIIVSYSRPFTSNKPLGKLSTKWGKYKNAKFREKHETILELRDKAMAHSDLDIKKVYICPKGTHNVTTGKKFPGLGVYITNKAFRIQAFKIIRDMCCDLKERLSVEIKRQLDTLYGKQELRPKEFLLDWR